MKIFKTEKKSSIIWAFFSSVKLTIVILIILAIASILGTLIPQKEGAIEFARGLSPELFRLFSALNLFDMYHAVWFRLLIACLVFNLVICSINRFPRTWKRFHATPRPDRNKPFDHLPTQQSFLTQGDVKETADSIGQFLESIYKKIYKKEDANRHYFYGEKGRYSHFGVYLVHLSVLIILVGALVGSFLGFDSYMNIVEGEKANTVTLRKGMIQQKLGFEVRCDKFIVDFYKNGTPKEYRSELSFFIDGKQVEKRSLLVNHPVQFEGITFFQASYNTVPGKNVRLKIIRHGNEHKTNTLDAETGDILQLPGNEGQFQVEKVSGNLRGMMGPAALIRIRPHEGKETLFWVFQNEEMLRKRFPPEMFQSPILNSSAFKPYTFFLEELESKYSTGLQVNKDPGVPIVWLGCFLMVAGFFVTFFTSHRRIWIRLSKEKQGIKISVSGTANKNRVGLQRELKHLTNNLKKLINEKG